jgi:hypothetical protein
LITPDIVAEVLLTSLVPPATASMNLVVRAVSPVKVSPSILYFTKDDSSTSYQAEAMVRVTDASETQSAIECSINDEPVTSKSNYLGNGIYSVHVNLPANTKFKPEPGANPSEEPAPKLQFHIRNPTDSWQQENLFSFPN